MFSNFGKFTKLLRKLNRKQHFSDTNFNCWYGMSIDDGTIRKWKKEKDIFMFFSLLLLYY